MKKHQWIPLCITILFCIDYSISSLLHFSLLYDRIKDMGVYHSVYAFVIGICAFLNILLFKKEE